MLTDTIAQFLTKLRNASKAKHETVTVRSTKMIKAVSAVLAKRGFIKNVREIAIPTRGNRSTVKGLLITLDTERDALSLTRVSKPGQRIYVDHTAIRAVRNGFGIGIISTSKGVIADSEARKLKVGGEYICKVY